MDLSLNTYLDLPENGIKKQQSGKLVTMTEREKDHSLVQRVQRGDKVAFEMLFTKYQRRVSRLVSRFVRSDAEVEDIVQEFLNNQACIRVSNQAQLLDAIEFFAGDREEAAKYALRAKEVVEKNKGSTEVQASYIISQLGEKH